MIHKKTKPLMNKLRINRVMFERGLFSYLHTMIIAAYYSEKEKVELYVDWSDADNYLDKKMNLFDHFFEQPFGVKSIEGYEIVEDDCDWNRFWNKFWVPFHKSVISHSQTYITKPDERERFSKLVRKYVKIKPHFLAKVDNFYMKYLSKNTLAVHIRGLDMRTFFNPYRKLHKLTPPIWMFYRTINMKLKEGDYDTLFICSDDQELVDKFLQRYSKQNMKKRYGREIKVVVNPSFKAGSYEALHLSKRHKVSRLQLAEEVLIDCLLMSRCKYLINQWSNVPNFAAVFNPNLKFTNITNSGIYNFLYYIYYCPLAYFRLICGKPIFGLSVKLKKKSKNYEQLIKFIKKKNAQKTKKSN